MLLAALSLPLAKSYLLASALACTPQAAQISVDFQVKPITFDYTKTSKELDWIISVSPPYGMEGATVEGLTDGKIRVGYSLKMGGLSYPQEKTSCLWIKSASIIVEYTPTVYVAKQHAPGSCDHEITKEHELLHVDTDIAITKRFLSHFRAAAEKALAQRNLVGPIPAHQTEQGREALKQIISQAMKKPMKALERARRTRHAQIDLPEQYRRESAVCQERKKP